jgi:hypothetical protein
MNQLKTKDVTLNQFTEKDVHQQGNSKLSEFLKSAFFARKYPIFWQMISLKNHDHVDSGSQVFLTIAPDLGLDGYLNGHKGHSLKWPNFPCTKATSKFDIALVCYLRNRQDYRQRLQLRHRKTALRGRSSVQIPTPKKCTFTPPEKPLRERILRDRNEPAQLIFNGHLSRISETERFISRSKVTISIQKNSTVSMTSNAVEITTSSPCQLQFTQTDDSQPINATLPLLQGVSA